MKNLFRVTTKLILINILILGVVMSQAAFAENVNEPILAEQTDDGIKIVFNFPGDEKYFSYIVLYPNKKLSNEVETVIDDTGIIVDTDQAELDENGSYEKTVKISNEPYGIYKIQASYSGKRYFADVNYKRNSGEYGEMFRKAINSSDDLLGTLAEYSDLTGVTEVESLTTEEKEYIIEAVKEYIPLNSDEEHELFLNDLEDIFKCGNIIKAINSSADENELAKILESNKEVLNLLFDTESELGKKYLSKVFAAIPINSRKIFEDLNIEYILETINTASWGAYYRVIKEYPQIGIEDIDKEIGDIKDKDAFYKALAEKAPFGSLEDFKNKFYEAKREAVNKKDNSGGGSSGGSRSNAPTISIKPSENNMGTNKTEEESVFEDIAEVPWAYESITELKKLGVISGVTKTTFEPLREVKREEFVKMMIDSFGYTVLPGQTKFADVDNNSWYVNYIYTANKYEIVNGTDDEHFGVGNSIKREDAAVMISRAASQKGKIFDITKAAGEAADISEVSDYASEAVATLYKAGIINGDERGYFNPKNTLTRAEAAKIIYSVIKAPVQD